MTTTETEKKTNGIVDWIIRLLKGLMVGIGFITPGLSGGVLAVVFGIYERLMRFLGNFREKFIQNVLFFLPVGIGGAVGVVAFSAVVDYAFTNYAGQFTLMFIGFIVGTFPSLFKTAGKEGRKWWHWLLLALMSGGTYYFMHWMETVRTVQLAQNFVNWLLSGAMIGLGVVVPGMSPSNFLIYLGLYQPMAAGIKNLDFRVIIPLMLGGVGLCAGLRPLDLMAVQKILCHHVPPDPRDRGRFHACHLPLRNQRQIAVGRYCAGPGGCGSILWPGKAG